MLTFVVFSTHIENLLISFSHIYLTASLFDFILDSGQIHFNFYILSSRALLLFILLVIGVYFCVLFLYRKLQNIKKYSTFNKSIFHFTENVSSILFLLKIGKSKWLEMLDNLTVTK